MSLLFRFALPGPHCLPPRRGSLLQPLSSLPLLALPAPRDLEEMVELEGGMLSKVEYLKSLLKVRGLHRGCAA